MANYRLQNKKLVPSDKTCPLLTVTRSGVSNRTGAVISLEALSKFGKYANGKRVIGGQIMLRLDRANGEHLAVESIEVDEELQRCGIATRLYELAAAEACKMQVPLRSDTIRTKCSEGFWAKQVVKKRAKCLISASRAYYDDPGRARGRCGAAIPGRGGCMQYELKSCETNLGRAKRRR